MSSLVDEDVLGFEVAVCYAFFLVQELEDQHDLADVESCPFLGETLLFAKVGEDFAAGAVVELRDLVSIDAGWTGEEEDVRAYTNSLCH